MATSIQSEFQAAKTYSSRLAQDKLVRSQLDETCATIYDWQLDTDDLLDEELYPPRQQLQNIESPRPRVRLLYHDEGVRERFCANAQRLLDSVLDDPQASSKSSRIARKALRYRNVMNRLNKVDRHDPAFDVSTFFGIEWQLADTRPKTQLPPFRSVH